jgi:hypothetical protein
MSRAFGFIGVLIAVAIGAYIYSKQIQATSPDNAAHNPKVTINVVGVKNDLVALAQAERRHLASEGKYVSLEELHANGDTSVSPSGRGAYVYSASVTGNSFRITATYQGPENPGVPLSFSIDDNTMEINTP